MVSLAGIIFSYYTVWVVILVRASHFYTHLNDIFGLIFIHVRARLHQWSASTLSQLCDNAKDSLLIANNGVTSEWGCHPFSSEAIVFNENKIASIMEGCCSVDADTSCKRALTKLIKA